MTTTDKEIAEVLGAMGRVADQLKAEREAEVCGAIWDLGERITPGVMILTCARKPHSTRAWHKTADGNTAWKDAPKKPKKTNADAKTR